MSGYTKELVSALLKEYPADCEAIGLEKPDGGNGDGINADREESSQSGKVPETPLDKQDITDAVLNALDKSEETPQLVAVAKSFDMSLPKVTSLYLDKNPDTTLQELKKLTVKPKSWTTEESLEEMIEGLEKAVKKTDQEIRRYKEKIKGFSFQD